MLLLDTERVALQPLFDMVRRTSVGFDVELHKRTLQRGLLSLIGPESGDVAAAGGARPERARQRSGRDRRDRGAGGAHRRRRRPLLRRRRAPPR